MRELQIARTARACTSRRQSLLHATPTSSPDCYGSTAATHLLVCSHRFCVRTILPALVQTMRLWQRLYCSEGTLELGGFSGPTQKSRKMHRRCPAHDVPAPHVNDQAPRARYLMRREPFSKRTDDARIGALAPTDNLIGDTSAAKTRSAL